MKKFLFAVALALSAVVFAADPPSDTPKKTEQMPQNNPSTIGRSDDSDAANDIPRSGSASSDTKSAQSAKSADAAAPSAKDIECLAKLHHDNEMEIQMGKLAKKNGQSKQVKHFGELLIKDHSLADQQLTALAKKKNIDLTMPEPKDEAEKAEHQAAMDTMNRLETLKGEEFDREFAKMMVEDHQKAIDLIQGTLTQTTDAKVSTFLNKVLPVIKEHKRVAESLNKKLQSV